MSNVIMILMILPRWMMILTIKIVMMVIREEKGNPGHMEVS